MYDSYINSKQKANGDPNGLQPTNVSEIQPFTAVLPNKYIGQLQTWKTMSLMSSAARCDMPQYTSVNQSILIFVPPTLF
jgi:hypothetical protein